MSAYVRLCPSMSAYVRLCPSMSAYVLSFLDSMRQADIDGRDTPPSIQYLEHYLVLFYWQCLYYFWREFV